MDAIWQNFPRSLVSDSKGRVPRSRNRHGLRLDFKGFHRLGLGPGLDVHETPTLTPGVGLEFTSSGVSDSESGLEHLEWENASLNSQLRLKVYCITINT